ncbi:MAG: DUF3168 domain-containing protein [Anaerolineales bacterium]|nr:DUF3168 domain-containing protein [Anaerolineales bacterium]
MLTQAIYDILANDEALRELLAVYRDLPAVFTTDPAPGDAVLPYIVSAGDVVQLPLDTKTTRGRDLQRDIRCYAPATGSAALVEQIAERVRTLLHRQHLTIAGFTWLVSDIAGPIIADERETQSGRDTYGRVLTLSLKAQEV